MKKHIILSVILLGGCFCCAYAQQTIPQNNIALSVWIPDDTGLTADAQKNLHNKVTQIASKQGVVADVMNSRFVFTVNVVTVEKYLTATAPQKQAYKLDVTFYIGDGMEGKTFSSITTSVTGVGDNETKAYMNALKNINVSNVAYKQFVEEGKAKIVDYYNRQCDLIIREAQSLSSTQNYDEAIYKLMSIPDACTDCWKKAMSAIDGIYQKKIDYDCQTMLAEATNIWNAAQNVEGAQEAGTILSQINPNAKCSADARLLSQQIAERVEKLNEREWAEYQKTQARNAEIKKADIKAYRDIMVKYVENQPKTVYKIFW